MMPAGVINHGDVSLLRCTSNMAKLTSQKQNNKITITEEKGKANEMKGTVPRLLSGSWLSLGGVWRVEFSQLTRRYLH